jgi:predicted CXXCH cytochrome family protein
LGESSMSGYCVGCHATIHREKDASNNWVRHPSDAVLLDPGEFASYTTFNPLVPVARPDLTGWTGPSSTVTPGVDLAMCLSCHRAHGSPYPKMLGWDPTDPDGCVTCHSTKVTGTPDQYHVVEVDDCSVCHAAHGDGPPDFGPNENESLVAKVITTPNSGDRNVAFPSGGSSAFVSGVPDYDGICEGCHTQTNCYRNCLCDEHPLYTAGVPVDPGWDCTSCHSHSNQFCGPANQIHANHFAPPVSDDFSLDEDGCTECHAYGIEQCRDSPWFWDNKPIEETQVCGLICHGT